MKIYIIALAETKKELERNLSDHTIEVIERLFKLMVMPDSPDRNQWQEEIAGHIHSVDVMKGSKKFPTAKQIFKWTYGKAYDSINNANWMSSLIQEIEDNYNITITDDICTVMHALDNLSVAYFTWLSKELAASKRVCNSKIYKELDELV
jgi:hypothetical protein